MTIVTKKRYFIALLASIAGIVGALPFVLNYTQTPASTQLANKSTPIEEAVTATLEEEHTKALEAIRQEFGISQEIWDDLMNHCYEQIDADNLLLPEGKTSYQKSDDKVADHIKELLANEQINPDKVTLKFVENKESPLAAFQDFDANNVIQHGIRIDKQWLAEHPQDVQDAIIRHEMMHLKNYDSIEGGYMIHIVTTNGHTRDDYEKSPAVRHYRHHREFRADTLAGIKNIAIAQALQKDFATCMANQQEDTHGHPSNALRYEKMAQLISHMNTAKQA